MTTTTAFTHELLETQLPGRLPLLTDVAADIHAHPEIRFTEFHAAKRLSSELDRAGFNVERGYAGLDTAFVGTWSSPPADATTPTIAIFCEYDALEGIGHGCGHNLIAACGLGAALLIKDHAEADKALAVHLKVIGSPGEEGAAGKVPMIKAGVLDDVDLAMMIHPGGADLTVMPSLARVALDIDFTGRASHAAASPEKGINALDASTLSLTAIGLLRQQLSDDVRVHTIITNGGQAPNIIPESTAVRCFIRATDTPSLLNEVVPRVKKCFEGAAMATGCEVSIAENTPAYLTMETNPTLSTFAAEAFTAVGRDTSRGTMGHGSTDMGNVSQVVPSIHPIISLEEGLTAHTHEFSEAAAGPAAGQVVADGSVILAATALTVFKHPQSMTDVTADFVPTRSVTGSR